MSTLPTTISINVVDANGTVLQEFELPHQNEIPMNKAHEMGEAIATRINELRVETMAFEKKLEETCDCFWIKKSPEERQVFRSHSSECATWEMDNEG